LNQAFVFYFDAFSPRRIPLPRARKLILEIGNSFPRRAKARYESQHSFAA
jgi:hypothetical protein